MDYNYVLVMSLAICFTVVGVVAINKVGKDDLKK